MAAQSISRLNLSSSPLGARESEIVPRACVRERERQCNWEGEARVVNLTGVFNFVRETIPIFGARENFLE